MNRELLMLAQVYNPEKHNIAGWMASEKKDGQRCFWDGGVSRGRPTIEVPWANLDRKIKPIATGLWSRYGNVIVAPDDWLDDLPVDMFLDGELDSLGLQNLRTIVSRDIADPIAWEPVKYLVFDSPGLEIFQDGTITNPNFNKTISEKECIKFFYHKMGKKIESSSMFTRSYDALRSDERLSNRHVGVLEQIKLALTPKAAAAEAMDMFNGIVAAGGEGLMVRHYSSFWSPKRVPTLLKFKPTLDSEATVIGWTDGERRLEGKMGALVVKWEGVEFNIGTGFTDVQRDHRLYPLGTLVNFKYVSITKDGVPREARFSHIRSEE